MKLAQGNKLRALKQGVHDLGEAGFGIVASLLFRTPQDASGFCKAALRNFHVESNFLNPVRIVGNVIQKNYHRMILNDFEGSE